MSSPPVTGDLATPLCNAIVTILHASAVVQGIVGRSTPDFVVPFEDTGKDTKLPVYAYTYVGDIVRGGVKDEREAELELIAVAEGNGARETANKMCAAARNALTWNAFDSQGLDACLSPAKPPQVEGGSGDHEETRGLYMMRLRLWIWATAP